MKPRASFFPGLFLFCVVFLCASLHQSRAQTTILFEGFEGAFPGAWLVGYYNANGSDATWSDVEATFGQEGTHSGNWKGYCAGLGYLGTRADPTYDFSMSAFMAQNIDLSAYSQATLSFWYKIPSIETGFDSCEVYLDNTRIWFSDIPVNAWTQVTLNLNAFVGGAHTLSFEFYSDDSVSEEGWYLDDILVTATSAGGANPRVSLSPTNGPVGRAVSVSARGFPATDVGQPAVIRFDNTIVATQTLVACESQVDGAGFGLLCDGGPVSIIVPTAANGPHTIQVSEGNFQNGTAPQAPFTVELDFFVNTIATTTAPGQFVRGAPFPPQAMDPGGEANPALPPLPEGPYVPRRDSQPMSVQSGGANFAAAAPAPNGPADPVKLVRNTALAAAGDPPDANCASSGKVVLYTANTYMAYSTDGGMTFSTRDPTTIFPNTADGGLCCDQLLQYAPQIDRFIWVMQFWNSPRLSCNPNRYRLAVASPADVISSGGTAWTYWDLTSADVDLTVNGFMDYPDAAIGATRFYLTANVPCTNKKLIVRIPLSDFVAPGAPGLSFRYLVRDDVGYRLAQNSETRAYWAGFLSSSKMRIFYWDEASAPIFFNDYTIPTSPIFGGADYQSLTPASVDWLSFGGPPRNGVVSGVKIGNELWWAWNAGRDASTVAPARRIPHPRIDLLKVNADTFALLQYLPIWNPQHAFAYPALAANSEGEVGFAFAWGGGGIYYANHGVGILTGTPFLQNTFTSSHSGTGRWGDYQGVRRHYPETRLFSASGFGIRATTSGYSNEPRYVLFGRSSIPAPICLIAGGISAGKFSVHLVGESGEPFTLQGSSDFSHWSNLLQTTFQGSTYDFTDNQSSNLTRRFYRAVVP